MNPATRQQLVESIREVANTLESDKTIDVLDGSVEVNYGVTVRSSEHYLSCYEHSGLDQIAINVRILRK